MTRIPASPDHRNPYSKEDDTWRSFLWPSFAARYAQAVQIDGRLANRLVRFGLDYSVPSMARISPCRATTPVGQAGVGWIMVLETIDDDRRRNLHLDAVGLGAEIAAVRK